MSHSDKRTVHTDALDTLGTIIGPGEKRDAIHLAVEPVMARHYLRPGDHVGIENGEPVPASIGKGVGIVDPFLRDVVKPGECFWLVLYPRAITSLRHVWEHPAFPPPLLNARFKSVPISAPVVAVEDDGDDDDDGCKSMGCSG